MVRNRQARINQVRTIQSRKQEELEGEEIRDHRYFRQKNQQRHVLPQNDQNGPSKEELLAPVKVLWPLLFPLEGAGGNEKLLEYFAHPRNHKQISLRAAAEVEVGNSESSVGGDREEVFEDEFEGGLEGVEPVEEPVEEEEDEEHAEDEHEVRAMGSGVEHGGRGYGTMILFL